VVIKGQPHDGEFVEKMQITLHEKSPCEFAIAVSRETVVLTC